ncbi:hypothetical protein [Paraburkholderia sp. BL25I1N1]|nr:hypothetical protein [Paraburkholderia sp. BL25I1N1]
MRWLVYRTGREPETKNREVSRLYGGVARRYTAKELLGLGKETLN